MDQQSTVMVVDFRFVNPSDYVFIVRTARIYIEDADGKVHQGVLVSDLNASRVFEYYPLLGQRFNKTLVTKDKVEARESMDRMMCVRFDLPESALKLRTKLTIRIEDVDGGISEIVEEPHQAPAD